MKVKIEVEVLFVKEDDYIVAYCPALELSAYGKNIIDAKKAFNEEVKIFIDETHKQGTLEKYLLRNGWTLTQIPEPVYEPPRLNTSELFNVFKAGKLVSQQNVQIPVC